MDCVWPLVAQMVLSSAKAVHGRCVVPGNLQNISTITWVDGCTPRRILSGSVGRLEGLFLQCLLIFYGTANAYSVVVLSLPLIWKPRYEFGMIGQGSSDKATEIARSRLSSWLVRAEPLRPHSMDIEFDQHLAPHLRVLFTIQFCHHQPPLEFLKDCSSETLVLTAANNLWPPG